MRVMLPVTIMRGMLLQCHVFEFDLCDVWLQSGMSTFYRGGDPALHLH
jgi:hypothetical protein